MNAMNRYILTLVALVLLSLSAAAQLPQDPDVRKGTLKNGMTYYIRHNGKEAGIADFYIAQRVGSILEEPRQRGLAHFLEHMAFNGTKNFPGKNGKPGIVPWCESIGVKFGANLNAYTSIDQTVYHIGSAPIVREGIIDSCLLVLHDWSHYLLLEDEEIDTYIHTRVPYLICSSVIQHAVNQIHLRLIVTEVLTEHLLGNVDTEGSHLLTNISNSGFLLLFDGDFRFIQQTGTLSPCLLLSLLDDSVARLGSLLQYLSLFLACLLQDGFTFLLDIGQSFLSLVSLAQTFVDVFVSLVNHVEDGGKTILGKYSENHQERQ